MLENAITACPDRLWSGQEREPEFWYLAYHTLFWLDLYLSGSLEGFAPPAPFTLDELDAASVTPPVYPKADLLAYLRHCRNKCNMVIGELDEALASRRCTFSWGECTFAELLLYNLRHVQHHAAQLNLLLRQITESAPRWIAQSPSRDGMGR